MEIIVVPAHISATRYQSLELAMVVDAVGGSLYADVA